MPLDPQAKAFLDFLGITTLPGLETLTPEAARDRFRGFTEARKQMGADEVVHSVRDVRIPGPGGEIPIRIYTPDVSELAPVLIYFHGGGWVLGDLKSHDHVCRSIANAVQCVAESLRWRRQGSPLFHRPGSVDTDGLCTDDCGCISNRSHHTGLRLGLLCRMPDTAKDFAEMAKAKLTMPELDLVSEPPSHRFN
jgi:hypothetical protein